MCPPLCFIASSYIHGPAFLGIIIIIIIIFDRYHLNEMIVTFFINPDKAMLFILKGKAEGLRHMYMPIIRKGPVPQN